MIIKELLDLCTDDFCSISIYDKASFDRKLYRYTQEAISKFGYYPLLSWKIKDNILEIITRTEF